MIKQIFYCNKFFPHFTGKETIPEGQAYIVNNRISVLQASLADAHFFSPPHKTIIARDKMKNSLWKVDTAEFHHLQLAP